MVLSQPADRMVHDEELQFKVGTIRASVAAAGVVEHQSLDGFAEGDIGVFDLFDEGLPTGKGKLYDVATWLAFRFVIRLPIK